MAAQAQPLTRRQVETLNYQLQEGLALPQGNFNRSLTMTDHNFRVIAQSFDISCDEVDKLSAKDYDAKLEAALAKNPDLLLARIVAASDDEKKKT